MTFKMQTVFVAAAFATVAASHARAQTANPTLAALTAMDAAQQQSGGAAPSAASAPPTAAPKSSLLEMCGAPVELQLDVGVFLPRLRGNITYGGVGAVSLDLTNDLNLNNMETSFEGNLSATWKNWTLRATGTSFSTAGSTIAPIAGVFGTTPFLAGMLLNNSFSYWTFGVEAESWFWRPLSKQAFPWLAEAPGESLPVDLRFFLVAGGRSFGISQTLTNLSFPSTSSFSGTFGTVYGGGGLDIRFDTHQAISFVRQVDVYAGIEAGPVWPGSAGLFMQIRAGATAWFTDHVGLYFQYLNLRQNVNTGGYNLQSYVGGLNAGLSVRF